MRYLLVKYVKTMARRGTKMHPQMDEVVSVSRRLKTHDIQSSSVILDFQTRTVCQATLDGQNIPKEWDRIRDYYYQHYSRIIDDLEKINGAPASEAPSVADQSL